MSPTAQLVDKVSGALSARFSRRGFFARSAVVGSAIAANPITYALTPTDAYAAVCSCSGSNCDCGSLCCSPPGRSSWVLMPPASARVPLNASVLPPDWPDARC